MWDEDKADDHGCPQRQPYREEGGVHVNIRREQVAGHDGHHQEYAGDVDSSCNVQAVVDPFHLHLAGGEGEDEGY